MIEIKSENDDRYQHQSWLVRRWRDRYYLLVPFKAVKYWYSEQRRELEDADDWRMSFTNCWGLACGIAQGKMKWYYTSAEIGYPEGFAQYADDDLTSD